LVQAYEGEVHIVPDHDTPLATHELSAGGWCGPRGHEDTPTMWTHRDELARNVMEVKTVDRTRATRLAERARVVGLSKAPGESDEELLLRYQRRMDPGMVGYGTTAWWRRRVLAASWWIRRVHVESPEPHVVVVRARGPLGLPLPGRVRLRMEAELLLDKPINCVLRLP
jgi:hypothetical protein